MSVRWRVVGTAAACAALTSGVALLALPDHDSVARVVAGAGAPVSGPRVRRGSGRLRRDSTVPPLVTVTPGAGSRPVPLSFLGLSTEYWGLPLFERQMTVFARVLALIHPSGNGPLILRIGGDSADHTFWEPRARRLPRWMYELTPGWLRPTSVLVSSLGVKVIVDLNLVTGSPVAAAEWASAARADLPGESIVGFEIGNEPDIYSRAYWLKRVSARFLPADLSRASYLHTYATYARVLAQVAPHVPLVGPALAHPGLNVSWISDLLGGPHRGLGMVSAHRYPYSACVKPHSAVHPTIARLLSEKATAGMARTVSAVVRLAHGAGLPFRLTELNSVTCGGVRGISDAFATALWAPDALFELLQTGVDGVNLHVRARAINGAFALTARGLNARPLLYGLILFARTLGPGAQLVHLQLHGQRSWPLKAWAVRVAGGGLHVLLINKSGHTLRVALRLPARGPATVQRMSAPSARSRSGVTLNGQHLGLDGSWRGHAATRTIVPDVHGYELVVPRASAALLSLHLGPRADAPASGSRTR